MRPGHCSQQASTNNDHSQTIFPIVYSCRSINNLIFHGSVQFLLIMLSKKFKQPRIISRKLVSSEEEEERRRQIDSSIWDEDDERNISVQSGFVVYNKPAINQANKTIDRQQQRSLPNSVAADQNDPNMMRPPQLFPQTAANKRKVPEKAVILPGVSDEIESYPCTFCSEERVFLTRAGLEKHAQNAHPDRIGEILIWANLIQSEWSRRNKKALQPIHCTNGYNTLANVGAGSSAPLNTAFYGSSHKQKLFKECVLCNLLLDPSKPKDIQRHLIEHQNNDKLRSWLEAINGIEALQQLSCDFCNLVFSDVAGLEQHIAICHSTQRYFSHKKRNFICHLCARVCDSYSNLRIHKRIAHGIGGMFDSQNNDMMMPDQHHELQNFSSKHPYYNNNNNRNVPARIQCELCGLAMVRPSLLIRHMIRVHNRQTDFCAKVVYPFSKTLPPLCYRVDTEGHLIWQCCELEFSNKETLLAHRAQAHSTFVQQFGAVNLDSEFAGVVPTPPAFPPPPAHPDFFSIPNEQFLPQHYEQDGVENVQRMVENDDGNFLASSINNTSERAINNGDVRQQKGDDGNANPFHSANFTADEQQQHMETDFVELLEDNNSNGSNAGLKKEMEAKYAAAIN